MSMKEAPYTLINGSLYKLGQDDILQRCALQHERQSIIEESHSSVVGEHYKVETKIKIILQVGLWWPTLNKDYKS